jgi:hypothetical protein
MWWEFSHRHDATGRRQASSDHSDGHQLLAFHEGVGELGRADHNTAYIRHGAARTLQYATDRRNDARTNVMRGGRLDPGYDPASIQQGRIRVGATHVNANMHRFPPFYPIATTLD